MNIERNLFSLRLVMRFRESLQDASLTKPMHSSKDLLAGLNWWALIAIPLAMGNSAIAHWRGASKYGL